MPRVTPNRKEYMIKDLPAWISGKMHVQRKYQKDVAKRLNITQPAFSCRLTDQRDTFSYGDLLTLFDELGATDEEILRLMKLRRE